MTNDKVLTGDTMAVATAIQLENQEQAFVQAEEKLMDEDEEVTSVESGNVEDAMVNIALVQSVVESGDADLKERLRKRPRPSGRDLERLEHLQSSGKGGMAHSSDPLAVPNPLLNPIPKQTPLNVKIEPPEAATVPSPLPAISSEVTQESRGEPISESKRRVNFEDPPVTRLRGFSIDLDLNLEFPEDTTAPTNPDAIPTTGRNRAYSFECFAFGINAEEPLPPLDASSSAMARPRGDSIIFDPSSFHEGGIHEQKALGGTESKPPAQTKPSSAPSPKASGAANVSPDPVFRSMMNNSGSTALPVELLNKDGRIGIYLPEARRARIARFHAKRSKRVWRKRIKYDCRKKLADSRPRVKGRFVKRSDVDHP